MLKIRLQRKGKKKKAYFDIVVTEHTTAPKGQYIERLGSYDPHADTFNIDKDRLEHWMSNGAQTSPTVNNLLINNKVIEGDKLTSWKPKKKEKTEEEKPAEAPKQKAAAEGDAPAEATEEKPAEEEEASTDEKPVDEPEKAE